MPMTKLSCSVTHCSSNSSSQCCRPEILVGGPNAAGAADTNCASFTKLPSGATNSVGYDRVNASMPVSCEASHCVFNSNRMCEADTIQIRGSNALETGQTECATFQSE